MKSKLICIILFGVFNFLCFSYNDYELDKYKVMKEEVLVEKLIISYIYDVDENSKKLLKDEFINRLASDNLYPILESQVVREIEYKINSTTDRKMYEFQKYCILSLRLFKTDKAFDEMISILERGSILDDNDKTILLIKNISFHRYEKGIPILEKLAFDKTNNIHSDIRITCLKSLAIIGKPGVDLLIDRFTKWEENNESDEYRGELWPLSYSRDKRVIPLALRHLSNPLKRNEALSVLSFIGGKLPKQMKDYLSEPHLRKISLNGLDIPYNLFVGCDDIQKDYIEKIKNILVNTLDNYNEDYSIRLISAENLKYYPYPDVIKDLNMSMNNDPYILGDRYIVRERAKESLDFLKEYYPELFEKKK